MEEQEKEDDNRTNDIERHKHTHVQDQADEDVKKTKRIEELKKKQKED